MNRYRPPPPGNPSKPSRLLLQQKTAPGDKIPDTLLIAQFYYNMEKVI